MSEAQSFGIYVRSTMPTAPTGEPLDLAPGLPLPEGATPAEHPELWDGRMWVQGILVRVCPDLFVRPE